MKPSTALSRMLVCGLSLLILPIASAGDAGKKFEKMDGNGDGKITRVEHSGGAQRMFAELDTDGDKVLTVAELEAKKDDSYGNQDRRHELSAAEKLRMIDQNGDGRVTSAEHASRSDDMFDEMDTNNDRVLSRKELEAGHKMMKKDKRDS